jgi:FAD/FMN-containing dehydrogenase
MVEAGRDGEILPKAHAQWSLPLCTAHVAGAAARPSADATAFPQRQPHFVMNVHARWRDAEMDRTCVDWARKLFDSMSPYAAGTAYVNFMPGDEDERVEAIYGVNFARLAQIKRRYDPSNVFRINQNVKPSDR